MYSFLTESIKKLPVICATLKEKGKKEFAPLLKIADKIKKDIEDFVPKLHIVLSLRQPGMN